MRSFTTLVSVVLLAAQASLTMAAAGVRRNTGIEAFAIIILIPGIAGGTRVQRNNGTPQCHIDGIRPADGGNHGHYNDPFNFGLGGGDHDYHCHSLSGVHRHGHFLDVAIWFFCTYRILVALWIFFAHDVDRLCFQDRFYVPERIQHTSPASTVTASSLTTVTSAVSQGSSTLTVPVSSITTSSFAPSAPSAPAPSSSNPVNPPNGAAIGVALDTRLSLGAAVAIGAAVMFGL
ncbi:hypothetical protein K466DRAFT_563379 [Polyporus arcularius HHB13444]|uniref:Uncharacterized protein n=1 Tax=Polyporus arcularius HHB13444 TaxID=1314778 RepID=A0A5C3PLQ9_9APHY|nr:hypothetical protein K466DRAFT_563379 [Polyporus arcularius HHB13444]